jgi:NAD-dependent DNA ligase
MKDYILKSSYSTNDSAPAFVQRAMTWAKATNEITGLIRGLLTDGVVSNDEALYLRNWISLRPEVLSDPLVMALARRIERVFEDGVATPEELEELKLVLTSYGKDDNQPTTLPLDDPMPKVVFENKVFCFTGPFVSGKRAWCEEQVLLRAGKAAGSVSRSVNFLVIGTKVSPAWANQTYGRKIEAAFGFKSSGHPVSIVTEEHWLRFLN